MPFLNSHRQRAPRLRWWWLLMALVGCFAAIAAPQDPAVSQPTYDVELVESMIPMRDGVRLAVDLWRPRGAASSERFPVLLEYLPYRKAESRADRYSLYAYFVRRGYLVARVDIRGTGTSEGTLIPNEYSEIELADGEVVIDWLARQPLSNGNVGMFGISWGGFNAIQMAMRRPPALKAIVPIDATDDLYQDDVHFMDGMMHVDSWEMSQDLANAMPGAPDYSLDERYFAERFDQPPWFLIYKGQQRDGLFWDRASLKSSYGAIAAATLMIGGWYDGYRDAIPRMLQHMTAPRKAIIGPWSHTFPHHAFPQPGMEWRHEAVRWFDQWLKGRETGIMHEPALAVYVRRWHPPGPGLGAAPGFWRYEDGWPVSVVQQRVLFPAASGTLSAAEPTASVQQLGYVPSAGVEAGGPVMWFGDVAPDLRPSDAFGLVYETPPLGADLEILGLPQALLQVSSTSAQAHWFARLGDVAPDGAVTLVASAGQNGAHRLSARDPSPIVAGERFALEIEMHATSWTFPKGHRVRLTIVNAQWPMIWPTPWAMTTSLFTGGGGGTRLILPVVPPGHRSSQPRWAPIVDNEPAFPGYAWLNSGTQSGFGEISSVERNPQTGAAKVVATSATKRRLPWGEEESTESITHETLDSRPDSTSVRGEYATTVTLKDRTLRWESSVMVRSDVANFHYASTRRLFLNGKLLREKRWDARIPRDHQ